ncbi:DUF5791 family protein [Halococcus saccharolyticus]|uniref:Uncharacterized protein n=1 Tax=Halococcus saccharolyticus DSM 5350 TaxID=1227455 RepID=M0MKB4_9EURY|nr:DUF5791 family protein [Halococcus saccharolyticus]EMA44885.1 hypothetical protein C449_09519 [Halococcus saccharolyticus DSM 5350]
MQDALDRATTNAHDDCGCEPRIEGRRLVVDATDCPEEGHLAASPACRASVVDALVGRPVVRVRTRIETGVYVHNDGATALLVAAGRFVALAADHDRALATHALGDPLGAARVAAGRTGPVAEFAAATGLIEGARRATGYDDAFATRSTTELNSLTSASITPNMFHDIDDAGDLSPDELRARYDQRLRAVIEEHGVEIVADEAGVASEPVTALAEGESPELTLEEAAAILAVSEDEPDAEAIVLETRDHLLMGMTTAVLDVEAVESGIDGALDAREIQQKIEGRLPMDLDELATIHGYIEERKP